VFTLSVPAQGIVRAQHLTSAVATAADRAITRNLPLFATAYQQPFWEAGSDGTVTLRVFFFARQ
jgi:hypothetical protein